MKPLATKTPLELRRPHNPLKAQHLRYRNYSLYRERDLRDPEWMRPKDFEGHTLQRPVVLVNGAFDLWHASHMRLLFAARHKGATVVVALDGDKKVEREKGRGRPILSWIERATALHYMPVDYICEIQHAGDMRELVKSLSPDLRVQGEEYRSVASKFPTIKKVFVRNGRLHTTTIIDRILRRYAKKGGKHATA